MTKVELKQLGAEIAEAIPSLNSPRPFIGTWMGRAGWSLELKAPRGSRVVIHKFNDSPVADVTHNKGDFWRDPDSAVTYWKVEGVAPKDIIPTILSEEL